MRNMKFIIASLVFLSSCTYTDWDLIDSMDILI